MFTVTIEDSNGQIADRFTFDHGAYVIGRHESCDIVLPSSSVSRRHARIFVDNGRCYVEDMGSSNGVVVDGQRVIRQRDLGTASQIRIGDFYLYLEYKRQEPSRQNVLQTLFISDDKGNYKLVRINDSFAGEEFSLSEIENTIGRTDDNFILLSDASISRHHAKVVRSGEQYTAMDLGSSNGTRVNGKTIKTPQVLKVGDRVHFGNVEFVFAPGEMHINPADYAGSPNSSNLVLLIGVTVLVLLGLAAGGVIVFGFWSFQSKQDAGDVPAASATVEMRVSEHIRDGKQKMQRREWQAAVASFEDALAIAPDNADAAKLKKVSEHELNAIELLEEGERLLEEGRHEQAKKTLERIPEDSQAYERAQPTLKHIRTTLAYNLKNEALRLAKSKKKSEVKEAHERIVESLEIAPDDEQATELVADLEKRLKKLRVDFEPYSAKK